MSITTSETSPLNRGRPLNNFTAKPKSTLPPALQLKPLRAPPGKKQSRVKKIANKMPRTAAQQAAYKEQAAANAAASRPKAAVDAEENARKILQLSKESSSAAQVRIDSLESSMRKQQHELDRALARISEYEAYVGKVVALGEQQQATIAQHVGTIDTLHAKLQEERSTVARYATALENNSQQVQSAFAGKALSSARLEVCQLADKLAEAECSIVTRDEQLAEQSRTIAELQQCIITMNAERERNVALRALYGNNPRQKRARIEATVADDDEEEEIVLSSGSIEMQAPAQSPLMSSECVSALVAGVNLRHAFDGSASHSSFEAPPVPTSMFSDPPALVDIVVPQPPPMATTFANSDGIDSFECAEESSDNVVIDIRSDDSDDEDSVDEDVPASPSISALTHQVADGVKVGKVYMMVPTDVADRSKFNELKAQLKRAGIAVTTGARRAPSKLNGSQVAVIFTGTDDTDRAAFADACASDWFAPVMFSGTPVMFAHQLVRAIESKRPTTVEEFTALVASDARGSTFCFSTDNRSVRGLSPLCIDVARADSSDSFLRSIITNFGNKGVRVVKGARADSIFHSMRVTDIAEFVCALGAVFGFAL